MASIDIKIVYTPYNFFTWAKQNNIIPEQSFLVCAQPAPKDAPCLDDKNHYFVISDKLNEGQQTTQVLTEVAGYLSNSKKSNIQEELSALMANWLLFQSGLLNDFSYDKNNEVFILQQDLIHPIITGLNVLRNKGMLAADLLVYIGEQAENFGNFSLKGYDSQDQLSSFIGQLEPFCNNKTLVPIILEESRQAWFFLQKNTII